MGIQIDENKLSLEARKALQNAKSKSQFMRDAIEFYVSNRMNVTSPVTELGEVKEDIKDIKNLLNKVLNGECITAKAGTSEKFTTTGQKQAEDIKKATSVIEKEEKNFDSKAIETSKEDVKDSDIGQASNIDHERKMEVESMLNTSINNFF